MLTIHDDRQMRALTGLALTQFEKLLETFSQVYHEQRQAAYDQGVAAGTRQRRPGGGAKGKLPTLRDKLLLPLYYYKVYPTFDVLGTQFEMARSKACENLSKWSQVLYTTLVRLGLMPYREFKTPAELKAALQGVDTVIIDATGLSLNQYGQWIRVRNGEKKMKRKFVKIHLAVDKESNKILVGLCSKGWKHDHKFGVQLVKALRSTCRRYSTSIDVELLDAGYLSRIMTDEIEKSNAKPYIKMKKNSTTKSRRRSSWKRNIRLQKDHPEEFMKVYCYRVVIEGIISAFKKVFGSMIASKKRHHQNVEVLCRLVLWNCIH